MNVGSVRLQLQKSNDDGAAAKALLSEALAIWETAFATQPQHPSRRKAAEWLIACLLVRARTGVNRRFQEAKAKRLCAQYGFDLNQEVANARQYPDAQAPSPAYDPTPGNPANRNASFPAG